MSEKNINNILKFKFKIFFLHKVFSNCNKISDASSKTRNFILFQNVQRNIHTHTKCRIDNAEQATKMIYGIILTNPVFIYNIKPVLLKTILYNLLK